MKHLLLAVTMFVSIISSAVHAGAAPGPAFPPPPQISIEVAPRFIFSPPFGFYISVGIPYDIVYIGNDYYLFSDGYYYKSRYYDGPWVIVEPRRIPPALRRHSPEDIRHFRDEEFRRYTNERGRYRGRWHTPPERRRQPDMRDEGPRGERPPEERPRESRPHGAKPYRETAPYDDRRDERPRGDRPRNDDGRGEGPREERRDRPYDDRRDGGRR